MNPLPQYSEPAFRHYEPHLAEIIKNYPSPTIFAPNNCPTFCARMRDAVRGLVLNGWEPREFTILQAFEVFKSLNKGGKFVFTITSEGVYCGPPIKQKVAPTFRKGNPVVFVGEDEIDATDGELFHSILCLKRHNLILEPISFRNVSATQQAEVKRYQHLEFFESDPGLFILI